MLITFQKKKKYGGLSWKVGLKLSGGWGGKNHKKERGNAFGRHDLHFGGVFYHNRSMVRRKKTRNWGRLKK